MRLPDIQRLAGRRRRRRTPGIVHQNIDRSQLRLDLGNGGLNPGQVPKVPDQRQHLAALCANGGSRRFQLVCLRAGNGDFCAFFGENFGNRGAKTAR